MVKKFVIDNSVVMSWCFEDEQTEHSQRILKNLINAQALVPGLWPYEIANGLMMAQRRKRITAEDALKFLGFLKDLPIQIDNIAAHDIWFECKQLATEHDLTVYDASYLYLAKRHKLPLGTFDVPLIKAAHRVKVAIL